MVVLYHASPFPLPEERLQPATRNVAVAINNARPFAYQVAYDDNATPYVYAAGNRAMAATYAVPKGVRFGNMTGLSGRAELLFLDQEGVIGDPDLQGGIYGFESDDFIPMVDNDGNPNGQWVSAAPCNLRQADYTPLRSFNDIMREGVQIYQVADSPVYDVDSFCRDIFRAGPHAALDAAVRAGRVRWLNEERGICPVYDLAPACYEDLTVHEDLTVKDQPAPPALRPAP